MNKDVHRLNASIKRDLMPAYQNGIYKQVRDIHISVYDYGFIHSDATYEVIPVRNNEPLYLKEHLTRLTDSIDLLDIFLIYYQDDEDNDDNDDYDYFDLKANTPSIYQEFVYDMKKVINKLITSAHEEFQLTDMLVWIIVTRGKPEGLGPREDYTVIRPNIIVFVKPYFKFNSDNKATVMLASNTRISDESFDQEIKNMAWVDLSRAQREAQDRFYDTAILLDSEGYVTEGPGFNVAYVYKNNIISPMKNCLRGITISKIKEYCDKSDHLKFRYADIPEKDLMFADAIILTSSAGGVIEVVKYKTKIFTGTNPVVEELKGVFNI